MKDIYFSQSIVDTIKNDIKLNFSKKINKNEKLFLKLLFFKIISSPTSLKNMEIELNDMMNILGLTNTDEFHNFLKNLIEKHIYYSITTSTNDYSGIFSIISSYILSGSFCKIFFTEEFTYCFSHKKNIFSLFEIEKFIFMEDNFSFNLYTNIIKSLNNNPKSTEIEIPLSTLKFYLNSLDKYSRFYDFEKYILKKAVFDINTFTDFNIKYKKIKSGKKATNQIIAIKFYIKTSKKIPILYDDAIYKMMELVKNKIENPENIYNLLLSFSNKRGYKYVYDNIEILKNTSSNNFEKRLRKALLLDLASTKLKLYLDINKNVKSPSELFNIYIQNINIIKKYYPTINILQYNTELKDMRHITFFKENDTFSFIHKDIEIFIKYHTKKKSTIKIYLPNNIINLIKSDIDKNISK